jgi:hypothetical protein
MLTKGSKKTNGIESWVIDCICLNYSEEQALQYLSSKGYDINARTYYRVKKAIQEDTQGRLNLIAQEGFIASHIETLDVLRMIQSQLIELAKREENNTKKANILMQLAEIRDKISVYIDASKWVLEQGTKLKRKRKQEEQEQGVC